jgi:hypothetical protein
MLFSCFSFVCKFAGRQNAASLAFVFVLLCADDLQNYFWVLLLM